MMLPCNVLTARYTMRSARSSVKSTVQPIGVDAGPPGADNMSAMHADTTFGSQATSSALTQVALPAAPALLSVSGLTAAVSVSVSITGIVIICPAGGVLG